MNPARRAARSFVVLVGLFTALIAAHWPLLHLPYYWDEAGYYIPAGYDFFRRGVLIPYSTLSNAHPPLPSIYLAGWWRVFGFSPFVTRVSICLVAAIALAGVYRLAWQVLRDRRAAVAVLCLTALYPVWFIQSTLAHADIFAAASTLWGLALLLEIRLVSPHRRSLLGAVICFALAALAKEIAIGTPLALALWELGQALRLYTRRADAPSPAGRIKPHLLTALALTLPALPLAAWFGYHRWRTGFLFGNPEYLRYNATATLQPARILLALAHRALHLTAHLNLFVPVMVTFGCLVLPVRAQSRPLAREHRAAFLVVLLANWVFFSILGGALLTRYLLPLYPLVLLFCVDIWRQRLREWYWVALPSAGALLLGIFINPPYRFAPEDTLAYRDQILLEQSAIAKIQSSYGRPTVLTAWPVTDGLTKPELGYVGQPLPVIAIDNFSYAQVQRAAGLAAREGEQGAPPFTVALLFSTKYEPAPWLERLEGPLGAQKRLLDQRYFNLHFDLPPEIVASMLGGEVVWRRERGGQWAAVLHFDRPQVALEQPRPPCSAPGPLCRENASASIISLK